MNLYTLEACEDLIQHYLNLGGEANTLQEGCLGLGTMLLTCTGLKNIIIQEKYLNEWSSGHTIRKYNYLPKKYEQQLNNMKL